MGFELCDLRLCNFEPGLGQFEVRLGGFVGVARNQALFIELLLAPEAVLHAVEIVLGLLQFGACRSEGGFIAQEIGLGILDHEFLGPDLGEGRFILSPSGQGVGLCLDGVDAQQHVSSFNGGPFTDGNVGYDASNLRLEINEFLGADFTASRYFGGQHILLLDLGSLDEDGIPAA